MFYNCTLLFGLISAVGLFRYNLVMNSNFIATFLMWAWAEYDVAVNGNRYLPRSHWDQYSPNLIAEASYALATILAYGRLLYFFQIGHRLGPLQVRLVV